MSTYSTLVVRETLRHKTAAQTGPAKSVQSQTSRMGFILEKFNKLALNYIWNNKVCKERRKLYERKPKWETFSYHIYRWVHSHHWEGQGNSQSLLKLMSIELVMSSNHLILCHPLLLLPSVFPGIRVFANELVLRIRWPK